MNVAVHQEKWKNEKTGKRKVGEERRQATNFKEKDQFTVYTTEISLFTIEKD